MEFSKEEIVRAFAIVGAVKGLQIVAAMTKTDLPADVWGEEPADVSVDIEGACDLLGIGRTKLSELTKSGLLSVFKEGKRNRYLKSELLAYLKRKRE